MTWTLDHFVAESNAIEGIQREPTDVEIAAHEQFLALPAVTVAALESFVVAVAGASLREVAGMDVRVGGHVPPRGGPHIRRELESLVACANKGNWSPYELHVAYETLHPFGDGNGRSGRALWAWQMRRAGLDPFALRFLHAWYYQSLDAGHS